MTKPALDLNEYHFTRDLGELTLFGTWITIDEEDGPEPCLAIVRTHHMGRDRIKPCVVVLNDAWRYDDPKSGHRHLLNTAVSFAKVLGYANNMTNVHKVADVIHSHLLDLIKMPPAPGLGEENRSRGAEVTITDANGRRISRELYDDR